MEKRSVPPQAFDAGGLGVIVSVATTCAGVGCGAVEATERMRHTPSTGSVSVRSSSREARRVQIDGLGILARCDESLGDTEGKICTVQESVNQACVRILRGK